MNKLIDSFKNPSGMDSMSNYMGEIPDAKWYVVMTRNRDSDVLTESNWECALKKLGGESDNVEVFRFGHWACGWWEALCVAENTESAKIGQQIVDKIDAYPVLDEDHFSEAEMKRSK